MCRSIKKLRNPEQPATPEEFHDAARQFVRKISGFQKPSQANREAFERAIEEVAVASRKLLETIEKPRTERA
jgi:hypothetical protein